jgi:hypothetical protein
MTYKSKINKLNLDTEAVKELELNEHVKPTRKLSPIVPTADSATTHRKRKGIRKIK